jgi:hypothetical protein
MRSVLIAVVVAVMARSAGAQLNFSLTQPIQQVAPGAEAVFGATLTNIGQAELYLNGYSVTPMDPRVALDDMPFFLNVPFSLQGGETWTGDIFGIIASYTAPDGQYGGAFAILGGSTETMQVPIANEDFSVRVVAVPEGSSSLLLLTGLGVLALMLAAGRHTREAPR